MGQILQTCRRNKAQKESDQIVQKCKQNKTQAFLRLTILHNIEGCHNPEKNSIFKQEMVQTMNDDEYLMALIMALRTRLDRYSFFNDIRFEHIQTKMLNIIAIVNKKKELSPTEHDVLQQLHELYLQYLNLYQATLLSRCTRCDSVKVGTLAEIKSVHVNNPSFKQLESLLKLPVSNDLSTDAN